MPPSPSSGLAPHLCPPRTSRRDTCDRGRHPAKRPCGTARRPRPGPCRRRCRPRIRCQGRGIPLRLRRRTPADTRRRPGLHPSRRRARPRTSCRFMHPCGSPPSQPPGVQERLREILDDAPPAIEHEAEVGARLAAPPSQPSGSRRRRARRPWARLARARTSARGGHNRPRSPRRRFPFWGRTAGACSRPVWMDSASAPRRKGRGVFLALTGIGAAGFGRDPTGHSPPPAASSINALPRGATARTARPIGVNSFERRRARGAPAGGRSAGIRPGPDRRPSGRRCIRRRR